MVAEIGRGAFGRVFLATEPALGNRQIVVKIAPHGAGEAEILGKLRHPNIVPIYSLQEDQTTGLAAFCMPYHGRATLCDLLDQSIVEGHPPRHARAILNAITAVNRDVGTQELPPPALVLRKGSYVDGVIHLARQLADALAHSHGRGICHRDLKPSNVLMSPEGRPLLLDFNLSIDAALPTWKIGGTLPYMAPEELGRLIRAKEESHARHYDPRSDIFSLGVIIYELLTGKLPFGTISRDRPLEEIASQLREQQAAGPRPICDLNGQVDRRLTRLVDSCLAFEPECRPETAQHLAAAFRRELSVTRRGARWTKNHRGLVFSFGTMLLTLTLAVSAYLAFRPPYSVRQLELGLDQLARGEYALGVDYLNNSIRANPDSSEALFARGRAYQQEGQFQLARQDFCSAFRLNQTPLFKACEGYCLSRTKYNEEAVAAYRKALECGYDSPAPLYNNMGFSYLTLGQVDKAEESLNRAILLDGSMQAAHHNMVRVFVLRAMRGQPVPKAAFSHAVRALATGLQSAELYHCVAALYAMAAKQDPALIQPAIEYVKKAIQLGSRPGGYASDAAFSALQSEDAFHDALNRPTATARSPKAVQLIDPLDCPRPLLSK